MKKTLVILSLLSALLFVGATSVVNLYAYAGFRSLVSFGLIPGAIVVDKFGEVHDVGNDGSVVWSAKGDYYYAPDSTAPFKYMVSSSVLDVGITVAISGNDSLGNLVTQTAISNGQNNVVLEIPLWRVWRMENISTLGNDLDGMIYVHRNPAPPSGVPPPLEIGAEIDNGNNQTLMTPFTIPKGYVAFLYRGELGMGLEGNNQTTSEYCIVEYKSRRFHGVFRIKKRLALSVNGNSNYKDERSFPDPIPALTDIQLNAEYCSELSVVWGTFDLLLMPEWYFPQSYLDKIGVPEDE